MSFFPVYFELAVSASYIFLNPGLSRLGLNTEKLQCKSNNVITLLPWPCTAIVSVIKAFTIAVVGPTPQATTTLGILITVPFSFKAWLVQGAAGVAALAMLAPRLQWVVAAVVC